MRIGRFTTAVVAAAAAVLVIAGCGGNDNPEPQSTPIVPATEGPQGPTGDSATPGVYAPIDTAVGVSGLEASILSVEEVNSEMYGPLTVFTFQIVNTTGEVWDGFNWSSPTIVYGPAGTPADEQVSMSEGFGNGVQGSIPPGMRQTVKHAYTVPKAELNPAVVSAGSVVWQGDFASFQR